jgi:hypothetical protein
MNNSTFCEEFIYEMSIKATVEERNALIILTLVNSISGLFTIMGNALVIAAILKTPSLNTPSFKLIISLCFSDLAVGLICHPLFILTIISFQSLNIKLYCAIHKLSIIPSIMLIWVSILTITAISVDRFLAVRLQAKYKMIVTNNRARILVILIWVLAIVITSCSGLLFESMLFRTLLALFFFSCLIVLMVNYHSFPIRPPAEIEPNGNEQPSIDVTKYKRILKTMLLILSLVLICYIPLFIVLIRIFLFGISYGMSTHILTYAALTISEMNSALNPIIYTMRMKDIRQACFRFFKKDLIEVARTNASFSNPNLVN